MRAKPRSVLYATLMVAAICILGFLASGGLDREAELPAATAQALADLFSRAEPAETRAREAAKKQSLEVPGFHNQLGQPRCCLLISHGGGAVDGKRMTNSLEALEASYAAGRRVIELDFLIASDGELVLAHDWDAFGGAAPSSGAWREFMEEQGLTPLDLFTLSRWLLRHQDAVIVTDTKDDFDDFFGLLIKHFPIWFLQQHFVFQVYSLEDLHLVLEQDSGFDLLLTLYKWRAFTPKDLQKSDRSRLLGVTLPYWRAEAMLALIRDRYPHLPLYLHALPNDLGNNDLLQRLANEGASGFYLQ